MNKNEKLEKTKRLEFSKKKYKFEKLKNASSLQDIAYLLGYKPSALSYILYVIPNDVKYTIYEIKKKSGGVRIINAPIPELKSLQKQLSLLLNDCFDIINYDKKSLSHGFRNNHSILTNAEKHKNKKYVFNIDLKDFFPSFNFGRVRGFFIKDNNYKLNSKVATIIAQIACYNNELPQGSPCSPIISNIIGNIIDIKMVNLAKKNKCTYSRYADDITFSTNIKKFPENIAFHINEKNWDVGKKLEAEINKAGFLINKNKTSMQFKTSRQITTGLVVNEKVNIKKEYYKIARSMCNRLFTKGEFYVKIKNPKINVLGKEQKEYIEKKGSLNQLEGMLSFLYLVKFPHYIQCCSEKERPSSITKLYRKFLFYKYFISLEKPLIISEGKTDIIYLKNALKNIKIDYTDLIKKEKDEIVYNINFLNISKNFMEIFDIGEGSSGILTLLNFYNSYMRHYKDIVIKHPVIILLDNDDGANKIKSRMKEQLKESLKGSIDASKYYNFTDNLYIIFAPDDKKGSIEDLFDSETLETIIDDKKFNPLKDFNKEIEYSKIIFANKVVKIKQKSINFENFSIIFDKFVSIINAYAKK